MPGCWEVSQDPRLSAIPRRRRRCAQNRPRPRGGVSPGGDLGVEDDTVGAGHHPQDPSVPQAQTELAKSVPKGQEDVLPGVMRSRERVGDKRKR